MEKEERRTVSIRLSPKGIGWLDEQAKRHGLSRTEVVRSCLAVAKADESVLEATLMEMAKLAGVEKF